MTSQGLAVAWLIVRVISFSVLAGGAGLAVAFIYRIRIRSDLPESAALVIGLGLVAIYLNTRLAFTQFVGGEGDPLAIDVAAVNTVIFLAAAVASLGGRSIGHRLAESDRLAWAGVQPTLNPIVRATGRFITVRLPETVHDIDGYDPVSDETKAALGGLTLDFHRGLTVAELEEAVVLRLTERFDVGYVDIDLDADGTVSYAAVGQRPAGLGHTIPPNSAAVAVRGDPPLGASAGDTVEIWHPDGSGAVGMGEVRATAEDIVTVVADRSLCEQVDPAQRYRLVTHPGEPQVDRAFAAMLRRNEETVTVMHVGRESPIVDTPISDLDLVVLAIEDGDDTLPVPTGDVRIEADMRLWLLGRPDQLRDFERIAAVQATELPIQGVTD